MMAAVGLFLITQVYDLLFSGPENTRLGATVYHGGAALFNAITIIFVAHLMCGQISIDLQRLGFCAMVINFLSWIAYLAQQSPVVFNLTITAVSYAQFARILWNSDGDDDVNRGRFGLVRWPHLLGAGLYPAEGKR